MTRTGRVAVVTIVHGRREHLLAHQRALGAGSRVPDLWVVVAMDEPGLEQTLPDIEPRPLVMHLGADDRGLPLAAARNLGAATAVGLGAEVLVLLDVDCLAGHDLVAGYAADVADVADGPGTVWSGPVTYLPPAAPGGGYRLEDLPAADSPHPARPAPEPGAHRRAASWELFWSLSFAVSAADWARVGGFCERYVGYGGEDTDFAQLARRAGLEHTWTGTPRAYHQHHGEPGPPVAHAVDIVRNAGIFHERWGWWPMRGWLDQLTDLGVLRAGPDGWEVR